MTDERTTNQDVSQNQEQEVIESLIGEVSRPLLGRTVLVVEDIFPMRMILKHTLTRQGATVVEAPEGEQVLGIFWFGDMSHEGVCV